MSLLDEAFEEYVILDKTKVPDGLGGVTTTYKEGTTILIADSFNNSLEARRAQAQGVSSVYTFFTHKDVILEYHDVVKRTRDGKVFRVTSDGDDDYTPNSAGLNLRAVSAEEWELSKGALSNDEGTSVT